DENDLLDILGGLLLGLVVEDVPFLLLVGAGGPGEQEAGGDACKGGGGQGDEPSGGREPCEHGGSTTRRGEIGKAQRPGRGVTRHAMDPPPRGATPNS